MSCPYRESNCGPLLCQLIHSGSITTRYIGSKIFLRMYLLYVFGKLLDSLFNMRMVSELAIPEIPLKIQNFSFLRLCTEGMTYPQRCFRQTRSNHLACFDAERTTENINPLVQCQDHSAWGISKTYGYCLQ
jgi:hypothetical protein